MLVQILEGQRDPKTILHAKRRKDKRSFNLKRYFKDTFGIKGNSILGVSRKRGDFETSSLGVSIHAESEEGVGISEVTREMREDREGAGSRSFIKDHKVSPGTKKGR